LKHQEPTSHAGHGHGTHDPADRAHAQVGKASCCSPKSALEPVEAPSLAAASAASGCCGSVATALETSDSALKDPVCGMTVTAQSPHVLEHEGEPVYFCSAGCKAKFAANPGKYLSAHTHAAEEPVAAGTIYTCPMHPEIRQDHPGACPKCGMALEPEMPSLEEGESPGAGRLSPALLADAAADRRGRDAGNARAPFSVARHGHAELGRAGVVCADRPLGGLALLCPGAASRCSTAAPNMWTLIGLGTGAAFVYSVVATVAPGCVPGVVHVDGSGVGLLRSGGRDHLADAARPAARAEGAVADLGQRSSRSLA
jgi:YHS domain-containing protein